MYTFNIQKAAVRANINSSYELGNKLGLFPSTAVRLWKGDVTRVEIETINKLCEAFDCKVEDLFEQTGNKKKASTNGHAKK